MFILPKVALKISKSIGEKSNYVATLVDKNKHLRSVSNWLDIFLLAQKTQRAIAVVFLKLFTIH